MSKIIIAGLDPALRNVGMAKGTLDLSEGLFELSTTALAQTTKNTTKPIQLGLMILNGAKQFLVLLLILLKMLIYSSLNYL